MASASEEVVMDSNLSKEEGEITDDDEIDELLAENSLLRQRERHHGYGYDTRVSRKYDVEASSSSSARQRDDSPSERYRGRDSHGSRHRHPYAESTRSGSCSSRQELPHHSLSYGKDRSSRDRYNQRDYHPPRNGQQLTPGSASYQNIAEDNHRPLSRHQEDTASESSLHPDYEKLLFEFRHVQERLKALKAQDEVEKTVPQAEVSSSKLSSAATDERRSTHHYDIVATPVKASSDSTRLDSPVVDEMGKSDQGLSDISSQETDCFTDNSTGDQSEAGKENGPPSLTSVARVTTAGAVMGADIVSDTVTTAVVDLGVLPSPVENGDEGARTDLPAAATSPPQVVEEEEDLDELELRRIALASAAARFKMTADDNADNENSESLSQMKIHPMAKEPLAEAILPSNTQCQSEPTAGESAAKPKSKPASELASHGLVDSRQSGSRVSGTGGPSAPRSQVTKNNSAITSQSNKSSNRRASGSIFIPNSGTRKNERPRNGNRSSPHRKAPPKDREISSSSRSSRADREKLDPPRRSRPLPFAPVKLDRIRLTSVSPRAGGIRDAARKAQMRARQSSVARQLPKSTGSSTLSSSPNTSSDRRRARDSSRARKKNDEKKEEEERKQEIAKILSLDDPKEQAERFLRLLSGSLVETASPSKVQHLKDNYEEVEMDIDSSDEVADELRIDEFQSAMQPIQFVGADTAGFGITDAQLMSHDLSLAGGQWLASPYLPSSLHPFSGFANYTTPAPPPKPPPPPSSQDTAAKNVGACVSDRPSLLGSSEMSESVSADISLAISFFRKSVNSEYIPFISDAKFHEPHIPFTSDAKSSKEYIPFISDGSPEEEHIPFISDAKPSDRQIPFISERSSNIGASNGVGIPFNRADASASPVCLSSDSAKSTQGNRGNQAAYDLKFVSEQSHIEVSSPLMTGDAPSPALSPGETVSVLVVSDDKSSPVSVATTHQSGAETSPVVADDEEENEEELRAQLLQSILLKRKEAETKQQASSVDSSPSASVTASPQRLVVQKTKGVSRKVSIQKLAAYSVFPIHKPVVVTLGESSSEEEEEDAPPGVGACDGGRAVGGFDIDGFLKAQRKTVEKQTLPTDPTPNQQVMVEQARFHKLEQERHLRRQEMELGKQRQDIVKGQSTLQQLLSKASKFLADMKKAETRATHLREQLHTTERLIVRYRHLVQTSKTQAKEVRDSLLKKKEMYGVAEMSTLSLGRQLHGNSYKPRMTNLDLGVKRAVEVVSKEAELKRSQQPTRAKQAKLSPAVADQASKENIPTPSASQHTAQARKKEKERLQMLAKEYEEKIRLLKSMQAPKGVHLAGAGATTHLGTGKCSQQRASPHKREKERLPSLETIKLEPVDGMVELEGKPRRRSLLDITHSPKPNLLIKDRQNSQDSSQTLKHKLKGGVEKTWTINFKMPSGLQLNNLCKIQREKMDKVLSVHTVECLEDFPHLELNCEPICGLKLHLPGNRLAGTVDEDIRQHKLAYTSPLLHFKAYRFSPYYRTKENLTISSASFSHKLNPNRILCRYDLSGTCNDQHCSWQHARDYSLSDKEVLMDLVAYCPQLAGVADDDSLDVRAKKIESYVDTLLSQHKGKMTTDELCLLLTARVSECAKHSECSTVDR
ncbi:hypothetical protein BaRGS_00008694 [Batillaria attramentaria]|uniref:Putative zinc-finger domain-containing protein n=1 Tax=Batillaria attramentaria TaxID=370345 RepID=A0ABD0LKS8_9CAEN